MPLGVSEKKRGGAWASRLDEASHTVARPVGPHVVMAYIVRAGRGDKAIVVHASGPGAVLSIDRSTRPCGAG